MASVEELAIAVLGLLADVGAMKQEQLQNVQMLQAMDTNIATLSTSRELQAVKDAQAVLNDANEQQMQLQNNQQLDLNARLTAIVARLDGLENRSAGLSSGAAGGKGWQLTRPKDMEPSEFTGEEE